MRHYIPWYILQHCWRESMFFVCFAWVCFDNLLPLGCARGHDMVGPSIYRVNLNSLGIVTAKMKCINYNFFNIPWCALFNWSKNSQLASWEPLLGKTLKGPVLDKSKTYQLYYHPVYMTRLSTPFSLPTITHILAPAREQQVVFSTIVLITARDC